MHRDKPNIDIAREAAGKAAAEFVQDGMRIGLGTGRTATYFIEHLSQRCKEGLRISAVATSQVSYQMALAGGIPILDIEGITNLDLTVDGADEVDSQKRMIKGGGGALLREKIVASMSDEMLVIVDQYKMVKQLGTFPLPVEILPFGYRATLNHLKELGYTGSLRESVEGSYFITENGNYIFDIKLAKLCSNPEKEDQLLKTVPGIIETGFFCNMADRIITGFTDGHFEIWG